MERITSASNPVVKRLKALREAKARQESGLFLVEGEVMLREALACGLKPAEALAEEESALTDELARAGAVVRLAVRAAIDAASADFAQGAVGAGRGTICYGMKGGIGSASRVICIGEREYTIGVLVQSNFGATEDFILNGEAVGPKILEWKQEKNDIHDFP